MGVSAINRTLTILTIIGIVTERVKHYFQCSWYYW